MVEPIVIKLDFLPPPILRGNARYGHWGPKAKAAKDMKASGRDHGTIVLNGLSILNQDQPIPLDRATIRYDFRHWRPIELDNLHIGLKHFVDGLVISGLLVDDSPDHLTFDAPTFEKVKKGEEGVDITLYPKDGVRASQGP